MNALELVSLGGWMTIAWPLHRLWRSVRHTSLTTAVRSLALLWLAWGTALWCGILNRLSPVEADLAWYAVAVVALVPPMAVLGSRRPIDRVWPWFVMLPLVLVFAWPALSAMGPGRLPAAWSLEAPVLAGYLLVLVMGAGNYLGLQHTLSALLWIASLGLVAGPLSPPVTDWFPVAPANRQWATLGLCAAGWLAWWRSGYGRPGESREAGAAAERIWRDFRELFGIVWARRVQERVNDTLRREKRPLQLALHGFEQIAASDRPPAAADPRELEPAQQALEWLLQKFVDREWLDSRR